MARLKDALIFVGPRGRTASVDVIHRFPILALTPPIMLVASDFSMREVTAYNHLSIPADLALHLTSSENPRPPSIYFDTDFKDDAACPPIT